MKLLLVKLVVHKVRVVVLMVVVIAAAVHINEDA
jgi:hypothetical protein